MQLTDSCRAECLLFLPACSAGHHQRRSMRPRNRSARGGGLWFQLSAPICEHMTAHDVQRTKILNERVIGDWQLRVSVARRETTEPKGGTGVSFPSRFVDNPDPFCPARKMQGCTGNHKRDETLSRQVTRTRHRQLGSRGSCSQTLEPS